MGNNKNYKVIIGWLVLMLLGVGSFCMAFEFGGGDTGGTGLIQPIDTYKSDSPNDCQSYSQTFGNGLSGELRFLKTYMWVHKTYAGDATPVYIELVEKSLDNYSSTSTSCYRQWNSSRYTANVDFSYDTKSLLKFDFATTTEDEGVHPVLNPVCYYKMRPYCTGLVAGIQYYYYGSATDVFENGAWGGLSWDGIADLYFDTTIGSSGSWTSGTTTILTDPLEYYNANKPDVLASGSPTSIYYGITSFGATLMIPMLETLQNFVMNLATSTAESVNASTTEALWTVWAYGQGINQITNLPVFQMFLTIVLVLSASLIFKGLWYLWKMIR